MSERILLYQDGSMKLDLDHDCTYIVTKWYKSSIAVFEEKSFKKYLNELDTKYSDNGNSKSVIKYLLSAAVSMMHADGLGWNLPAILREYASVAGEDLFLDRCPEEYKDDMDLPVMLIASESNIAEAISMTERKHTD